MPGVFAPLTAYGSMSPMTTKDDQPPAARHRLMASAAAHLQAASDTLEALFEALPPGMVRGDINEAIGALTDALHLLARADRAIGRS